MRRLIVPLLLLAAGCRTVVVSDPGNGSLPGIPFYPKIAVERQETVYLEPRYRLQVVERHYAVDPAKATGKPATPVGETVLHDTAVWGSQLDGAAIGELQRAVAAGEAERIAAAMARLRQARPACGPSAGAAYPDFGNAACFQLVTNQVETAVEVDTGRGPLYLNARRPLIGSAAVDFKLDADQTLTSGRVDVNDETAAVLLAMLPVREYLTARHVPSQRQVRAIDAVERVTEYVLEIVPDPLLHRLERRTPFEGTRAGAPASSPPPSRAHPPLRPGDDVAYIVLHPSNGEP